MKDISYYKELIQELRTLNPSVQIDDGLNTSHPDMIWIPEGTVLALPEQFHYNGAKDIIIEEMENGDKVFYAMEIYPLQPQWKPSIDGFQTILLKIIYVITQVMGCLV